MKKQEIDACEERREDNGLVCYQNNKTTIGRVRPRKVKETEKKEEKDKVVNGM